MEQSPVKKNDKLLNIAKTLRQNMTRHEKHLWYDFLQKYPVKIYKQRIIDDYVVDFYCYSARLVIELDGSQHYTVNGEKDDEKRTQIIEKNRLKVIRFSNKDIDDNFEGVCLAIDEAIKQRVGK